MIFFVITLIISGCFSFVSITFYLALLTTWDNSNNDKIQEKKLRKFIFITLSITVFCLMFICNIKFR